MLTEQVVQQSRCLDSVMMPLVFLYRHAIELALKEGIIVGYLAKGFEAEMAYKKAKKCGHDLEKAWKEFYCFANEFSQHQPDLELRLEATEALIVEFETIAPNGFGWRYEYGVKGKPAWRDDPEPGERIGKPKMSNMNILIFAQGANKILNVVEGFTSDFPAL